MITTTEYIPTIDQEYLAAVQQSRKIELETGVFSQALLWMGSERTTNFNLAETLKTISDCIHTLRDAGYRWKHEIPLYYHGNDQYEFSAQIFYSEEVHNSGYFLKITSKSETTDITIGLRPKKNIDGLWGFEINPLDFEGEFVTEVSPIFALALQCLAGELRKRVRKHEGEIK